MNDLEKLIIDVNEAIKQKKRINVHISNGNASFYYELEPEEIKQQNDFLFLLFHQCGLYLRVDGIYRDKKKSKKISYVIYFGSLSIFIDF